MQNHLVARSIRVSRVEVDPGVGKWGGNPWAAQLEGADFALDRDTPRGHPHTFGAQEGGLAAMEQFYRCLERCSIRFLHGSLLKSRVQLTLSSVSKV
jgi:hypothetical protein